jgi:hypothetical protein
VLYFWDVEIQLGYALKWPGQNGTISRSQYGALATGGRKQSAGGLNEHYPENCVADTGGTPQFACQHQIDFNTLGPDNQRINELWLVTYVNEAGEEVVVQAILTNDTYAPLIAADPVRLESMMPAARDLAQTRNIKMYLIKLTNRMDIEDIMP